MKTEVRGDKDETFTRLRLKQRKLFFTAVALSANSKRQGRAAEALMSKHQCQREQTKIVDNPRDSTTVRFYDVVLEVAR